MNRFIYYLIFTHMVTNIVATVPKILLSKSDKGAITSMILGGLVGLLMTYVVIRFFNNFPGRDLPELMKEYMSKWLYYPILTFFTVVLYAAGSLTLITYTFMLVTFLTPEMALLIMVMPFLIIVSYGVLMKTENILYTAEVIIVLFLPIAIFVFIKSFGSREINWDYVKIAMMHVNNSPEYGLFTASLFMFFGVANLIIFNKYFLKKQVIGIKHMLVISLFSVFVLFTTYFMPMGFAGFDKIDKLLYPWISTTDSVRMKFGLIERLVFMFMLFFVSISLITIVIQWHVAGQLIGKVFYFKRLNWKDKNLTPYLFAVVFSVIAGILTKTLTEYQLYKYANSFFNSLPLFFVILLLSMWAVKRGAKS